jgi:Xaa-Pro aminopeptidase
MTVINQRINLLRNEMKKHHISACIIANSDPHLSEYIADYWKEREWISGFTGSNGVVALTLDKIALWTDSRYLLQAEQQLQGTNIDVFITNSSALSDLTNWLKKQLTKEQHTIAINAEVFSVNAINEIEKEISDSQLTLVLSNLIDNLWENRPAIPAKKIFILEEKYAGKSTIEKLSDIRLEMSKDNADVLLITALDEIAWTFNIRGYDIEYNPLVIAYAMVEQKKCTLFIKKEKLTAETQSYLEKQGVLIKEYDDITTVVSSLSKEKKVLIDSAKTNYQLFDAISPACTIINKTSPVSILKSIKNETEIKGIKNACIKDGVALTRFFMWLEKNIGKETISEISIAEKLRAYRKEQALFFGESFSTIAGYKEHGAIVHYSATAETNTNIQTESFLLIDSGGQYFDGTTDITRTIALGKLTAQQKIDFTLVLKGHIAIATVRFPYGTCGFQLDTLARKALWDNYLNYGHGTGHGIGHFLNVHEGPQSIRPDGNNTVLKKGMILSNEPGVYKTNEYGIRTESMVLVKEDLKTEMGQFMQFETLTLFPIDKQAIDFSLLDEKEQVWLNNYHQQVVEKLSPHLNTEETNWLKQKTK